SMSIFGLAVSRSSSSFRASGTVPPQLSRELGDAPVLGSDTVKAHGTVSQPSNGSTQGDEPLYIKYVRTIFGAPSSGDNGPDPLHTCPVVGPVHGWDTFGAPRYSGGYHPHAGTDIIAPEGAPIVAPFPGTAVATPNQLGGNAV